MSTYHISPCIKVVGNILFVEAKASDRDLAWEIIVKHLAQGSCKLGRVSDTSFSVAPNEGYDIYHCLEITATALLFARQTNFHFYWLLSSRESPASDVKSFINIHGLSSRTLSNDNLLFIRNKLIKKYALEAINELIEEHKNQKFDSKKVYDLIEELRQGYRKLKFHQHDFWYRHFGGLKHDLGEIDCCLADAKLLLNSVNAFNSIVEAEVEQYKSSLGRKWNDSVISGLDEFEKDTNHIRTKTYSNLLKIDSAKFSELLAQVRNRAIRLFPD